ncbi:MAG: HipA domain-containing protein [Propionibacteriales bacterium]|nr:HipA domain-containing protein [Propionibacteriales bacterium]
MTVPDPKSIHRAIVHKQGTPAALLARDETGTTFSYLPGYDGPEVAHTLPRDNPPVRTVGGALPPFFSGLLPEGRRLTALRTMVKTSADDELSLLLAVGGDTIGDVTVLPEGAEPAPALPLLSDGDFSFAELRSEAGVVDRLALPGIQEKASGAMISLPVRLSGRAAIVKLDPPEYPDVTTNEHYFLGLAQRLRIPVAKAELIHDREGRPGLVVERFDRVGSADEPQSLAVEDACQLAGRYPADKYALSVESVIETLAETCPASLVAARASFQQFTLAWLTGNGDLHAKNISVLQGADGEWRVAPVYDIPSTLPYGDLTNALPMNGHTENLTRHTFASLAERVRLPARAADRAVDEVLEVTAPLLDDLRAGALPLTREQIGTLVRRLARRRNDLER